MVRPPVGLDPPFELGHGERAGVHRNVPPGVAPDEPHAAPGGGAVTARVRPGPVDEREIDVLDRAVEVEEASRKERGEERRTEVGGEAAQRVHMRVGRDQDQVLGHRRAEPLGEHHAAMRAVEDERHAGHARRGRVKPQHAGDVLGLGHPASSGPAAKAAG